MPEDKFESSKEIEEKGFRLWERFELDEALQVFVEGVKRFPEDHKLKLGLAFTRLDLGDMPEARALFEELLAINSKDEECWWGLGRIHLFLSNYGEARYAFDQALHLGKPEERTLLDVGREWYLLSMYEEAMDFYKRALVVNPKSPDAFLGLGVCGYPLGHEDAESNLKKALELDGSFHEARNFLGTVYYEQKRFEEALECFEKIPLESQNDPTSLRRLVRLLRRKGISEARLSPLKASLKRLNKEQGWDFWLSQIKRKGPSQGRG